ncbi:hypothetical protein E2320_003575 [Naja naja]|nr:hypothetical protein E2320_003575 [Naja naja]
MLSQIHWYGLICWRPLLEDFLAADVLFILMFPVIKVNALKCPEADPIPIPHEWLQRGDLLIGGIASQHLYGFSEHTFNAQPSQDLYGLSDQSSSLYFMAPNEVPQYIGIIRLLQHFEWKWIGLFVADTESGEHFLKKLELLFFQQGICFSFIQRFPKLLRLDDLGNFGNIMFDFYTHFTDIKTNAYIMFFQFLCVMNIVTLDIGRENLKRKVSAAMIVLHVHRERFRLR